MRKRIFGRRLKRDTNERKALFRSLMHGVIFHGKIKTTEAKAKSIKGGLEKLVTIARNGEAAKVNLMKSLANEKATDKLIKEIAPLFAKRPGGYTRILRLSPRVKDGAKQVLLTWVEEVKATSTAVEKRNKNKTAKPVTKKAEVKVKDTKEAKKEVKKSK